jgi:hypothetical protein
LRDFLLLLARVTALLLLAASFARPYRQQAAPAGVRVVAVDRSYSMGAPGRFARAMTEARRAIDAADRGERIALVAFDDRADVLVAPGGAANVRAALDDLKPGFGGTRYLPVFQRALELAAGAPAHLFVVTDLQRSGWEGETQATLPASWRLDVLDVGGPIQNLAVTSIGVAPDRVVASILNTGDAVRTGQVRAALDGHDVAGADYTVAPGAKIDVPIAWRPPETGSLAVSIDDPEGLAVDNVRYAALGAHGTPKALIVTGGAQSGLYLSRALSTSAGDAGGFDGEVIPGSRLAALSLDQMSNYPVVALLSTRGLERRARETLGAYLRGGGGLLVAAASDLEVGVVSALGDWKPPWSVVADDAPGAEFLTLAATDLRHPIFRPFGALAVNLGQVRFDRTWRVAPEGWSIIARFSNGTPALLERPFGQGRVVLFASDLDRRWNDFPLHPAFVPFALESVRYVAGAMSGAGDRRHTREYTVAQAPTGTGPAPGVYRAPSGRMVSVNVDTRESNLARLDAAAFAEMVHKTDTTVSKAVELQAQQTEARQSYWQYGLMVMIAALVAESLVGRA